MSHKLLSNLKWLQPGLQQYSMAGQVLAAAECVPKVVQVVTNTAFKGICGFLHVAITS